MVEGEIVTGLVLSEASEEFGSWWVRRGIVGVKRAKRIAREMRIVINVLDSFPPKMLLGGMR